MQLQRYIDFQIYLSKHTFSELLTLCYINSDAPWGKDLWRTLFKESLPYWKLSSTTYVVVMRSLNGNGLVAFLHSITPSWNITTYRKSLSLIEYPICHGTTSFCHPPRGCCQKAISSQSWFTGSSNNGIKLFPCVQSCTSWLRFVSFTDCPLNTFRGHSKPM